MVKDKYPLAFPFSVHYDVMAAHLRNGPVQQKAEHIFQQYRLNTKSKSKHHQVFKTATLKHTILLLLLLNKALALADIPQRLH